MSTKYILHGGMMSPRSEWNKRFYQEMVKDIDHPKVLLVYFSRELGEYDYLFNRDKDNFAWANPDLDIEFEIAEEKMLSEQLKSCNVIMLAGGDTQELFNAMERAGVEPKDFEGKTVAGSSAGAYYLSSWYYTNGGREVRKGSGIVPVAAWAHYRAERGSEYWLSEEQIKEIELELQEKVGDGKVVRLPEQEFITIEQID